MRYIYIPLFQIHICYCCRKIKQFFIYIPLFQIHMKIPQANSDIVSDLHSTILDSYKSWNITMISVSVIYIPLFQIHIRLQEVLACEIREFTFHYFRFISEANGMGKGYFQIYIPLFQIHIFVMFLFRFRLFHLHSTILDSYKADTSKVNTDSEFTFHYFRFISRLKLYLLPCGSRRDFLSISSLLRRHSIKITIYLIENPQNSTFSCCCRNYRNF